MNGRKIMSKNENKLKPGKWIRRRILFVAFIITVAMFFVPFRVAYLKYRYQNKLLDTLLSNTEGTLKLEPRRGTIYDRNGKEMAISVWKESLYANTKEIENPGKIAVKLSGILHVSKRTLEKKLRSGKSFVWLRRQIGTVEKEKIAALNVRGLYFKREFSRVYPYEDVAGQVLGFTGLDGHGLEGVELFYDSYLRGKADSLSVLWDALRKPIAKSTLSDNGLAGNSICLTIDTQIQFYAEKELKKAIRKFEAESGEVIVLDPRNGEILAMAVYPSFNPNNFRCSRPDQWRNRAITDCFEPGSTFKVILFASALESNLFKPRDIIFCENGSFRVSNHVVHDVHPRGWLTVADVMKYSSNIGAVKIGEKVGKKRFYSWIKKFGFGERTGVDLPGEAQGVVRNPCKWTKVDMAAACFGQGISVTPLQMTLAMACVANGGKKLVPHVMKKIVSPEGKVIKTYGEPTPKMILRPATSRALKALLRRVVQDGGTGVRAAIAGYSVAGKTGTSQSYDVKSCSYDNRRGTASFVGFAPCDEPKFVVGVFIHNPKKGCYGGVVSGPVFREVCVRALLYVGIPPKTKMVRARENVAISKRSIFTTVSKLAVKKAGYRE